MSSRRRPKRSVSRVDRFRLGITTEEHRTEEGLSLDMARPSMKVAVEFDGPTHYLLGGATGSYDPNGATSFKRRLLRYSAGSHRYPLLRVERGPCFEGDAGGLSQDEIGTVIGFCCRHTQLAPVLFLA